LDLYFVKRGITGMIEDLYLQTKNNLINNILQLKDLFFIYG